jgi:hypothetical protein
VGSTWPETFQTTTPHASARGVVAAIWRDQYNLVVFWRRYASNACMSAMPSAQFGFD